MSLLTKTKSLINSKFLKTFATNYFKYTLLFLNFGILLAASRYGSIYKDSLDLGVSNSVRNFYNLFKLILLEPSCILAVTFIRSNLKLKEFDKLFAVVILFSLAILKISELFKSLNYNILAFWLFNIVLRAQTQILFFLYLSDYMQQYINKLTQQQMVMYGVAVSAYGIMIKTLTIILFKYVGFSSMYYTLMYVVYLGINFVLDRYVHKDESFNPNPAKVNVKNLLSWRLTKRLFSVSLYLPLLIVLSAMLSSTISEVYENLKVMSMAQRSLINQFYHSTITRCVKTVVNKQNNTLTVTVRDTIMKPFSANNFYHYTESILEMFYCQILALFIFSLILLYQKYNIKGGKLVLFSLVPVLNVINTIFNVPSFVSLAHTFSSIDQGAKKPLKDISYTNFNYESKTFIKLYSEFCLEPISRIIGMGIALFIRSNLNDAFNPLDFKSVFVARSITLALASAWVITTAAMSREIYKRKDQKIDIFVD